MVLLTCLGCSSKEFTQFKSPTKDRVEATDNSNERTANTTQPAEIIEAAIIAYGGESNFAKANIGQTRMTIDGSFQPGISGRFTKFDIFSLPGKHKRTVNGESQGQKFEMNVVINGDETWIQRNGGDPTSLPIVNPGQGVYPNDSLSVLLALKGPDFQLSLHPAEKLDGRFVHRIRLETGGQWVGDSLFDKETHLLVASKKELFDSMLGKTRAIETYYSDYKVVDGLNLPMSFRVVMDGETTATITVNEVKFMDKIDDSVFAKPVVEK
jgi:hypothetical protein